MSRTQELVSLKNAADILGCGMSTLRKWDNEGALKAVRTPGGHRRYRVADLEAFKTGYLRFFSSAIRMMTLEERSALVAWMRAQPLGNLSSRARRLHRSEFYSVHLFAEWRIPPRNSARFLNVISPRLRRIGFSPLSGLLT